MLSTYGWSIKLVCSFLFVWFSSLMAHHQQRYMKTGPWFNVWYEGLAEWRIKPAAFGQHKLRVQQYLQLESTSNISLSKRGYWSEHNVPAQTKTVVNVWQRTTNYCGFHKWQTLAVTGYKLTNLATMIYCSGRQHFKTFFPCFHENRLRHFIENVSSGDNSKEMSNHVSK